jgi:hypothetical protein
MAGSRHGPSPWNPQTQLSPCRRGHGGGRCRPDVGRPTRSPFIASPRRHAQACKRAAQGAGKRGEGRSGGDAGDSPCTQGPAHERRRCAQSAIDANPMAFTKVLIGQGPGAALGRHLD